MAARIITTDHLNQFEQYLIKEEKSTATVEKYLRDVRAFFVYIGKQPLTKEVTIYYKKHLEEQKYALRSINSMLASVNSLLEFLNWQDCKVKSLKQQRAVYCSEEKELTKEEYMRLLKAAEQQEQLHLLMQTICATGIRVSELKFFTVEALKQGEVIVQCKNKTRTVLVPQKLIKMLLKFTKRKGIQSGAVFVTRNGKTLNRSNIWTQMKRLCKKAGVNPTKVFPHNLRKLFARTFYGIEKDIAKLADLLGHGNIETTRIYIMTSGVEHREKMERLGLVL